MRPHALVLAAALALPLRAVADDDGSAPRAGPPLVPLARHALDGEIRDLRVVPRGDGGAVALLGAHGVTLLVDGRVEGTLPPAHDVAAFDLDGDGARELLTCGLAGLVAHPWEQAAEATEATDVTGPCRALARIDGHEPLLAVLGDGLVILGAGGGERLDLGVLPPDGWIVGAGDALLAGSATAPDQLRWDPDGRERLTGPPAVGAARGPAGWVRLHVDGTLRGPEAPLDLLGPAGAVVAADPDGDGVRTAIVAHPDLRMLGWLEGEPVGLPLPLRPELLAAGDLDGDGADEVVVSDGRTLAVLRGAALAPRSAPQPAAPADPSPAAPAEVPSWLQGPPDLPRTRVLGLDLPHFDGAPGEITSGRAPARRIWTVATGLTLGHALGAGRGTPGSPSLALTYEGGAAGPRIFGGLDTAPILLEAGESVVWHVLFLTGGVSVGGPQHRLGVYGSLGLLGAAAGLRLQWQPFETASGHLHGLEIRLGALPSTEASPLAAPALGEVMIAWAVSLPGGAGSAAPRPPRRAALPDLARCRRFALSLGAAGGASDTTLSWQLVGTGQALDPSFSPALALACETGTSTAGLMLSAETAPGFGWRAPWDDRTRDEVLAHLGSVSVGPVLGNDVIRAGPYATAGVWILGGGGRVVLTPVQTRSGARHGLELRGAALFPADLAVEAMVLYTAWYDPRR